MKDAAALICFSIVLVLGVGCAGSARAVVILDSTWSAEGGTPGHESAGFGAHIDLAHKPQFDSIFAMSWDEGQSWDAGSATWLGNDAHHGYLLTAGHMFKDNEKVHDYLYRSRNGGIYHGDALVVNPYFNGSFDDRAGYDFAIIRLTAPVTDAGPANKPAVLYAGHNELGKLITTIGFGNRGIGSVGEDKRYETGPARFEFGYEKAAARNLVDYVEKQVFPVPPTGDAGNTLSTFLAKEDGSLEGPYDHRRFPVGRLDGLLGGGDSGGSVWMKTTAGWVVVAVNCCGGERYGDQAHFARVAGVRDWISRVFPGARFVDAAETGKPGAKNVCRPNQPVMVQAEHEIWYLATALGRPNAEGLCKIRYAGYGSERDEAVGVEYLAPALDADN